MNIFKPDLSTEAGTRDAMRSASTVLFIVAGVSAVVSTFAVAQIPEPEERIATGIVASLQILLFLVTAYYLRQGRGAILAAITTALYVLNLILTVLTVNPVALVLGVVITIVLVQGTRAAFRMRKGGFSDTFG